MRQQMPPLLKKEDYPYPVVGEDSHACATACLHGGRYVRPRTLMNGEAPPTGIAGVNLSGGRLAATSRPPKEVLCPRCRNILPARVPENDDTP